MDQRLKERPHTCEYETLIYEHGTHFVLPESMLRIALPIGIKRMDSMKLENFKVVCGLDIIDTEYYYYGEEINGDYI